MKLKKGDRVRDIFGMAVGTVTFVYTSGSNGTDYARVKYPNKVFHDGLDEYVNAQSAFVKITEEDYFIGCL